MLDTLARTIWNVTKWITGLIILFLTAYAANISVLQEKDISSTWLIKNVNWLFLPGFHRILTLSVLMFLFIITIVAGIITLVGKHAKSEPNLRNRLQLLEKVRSFWIAGVLEESLRGASHIELGLHEQPDAVEEPWHRVLQQPVQPPVLLPHNLSITQVYNDAAGELLILGEPGAGKTTLLLELARDLLDRAHKDDTYPIPVVFNLSTWTMNRQSIAHWLIEELKNKYQVPSKLGQIWVENDQILPLLDGLDEVSKGHYEDCVRAINSFRREHGLVPTVVCSRSIEYQSQSTKVLLRRAIIVQPLTKQQIEGYLSSAGGQLAVVRAALSKYPVLQELAVTPLGLSVLTLAYQGVSAEELSLADFPTSRQQVFETYVQRMFQHRGTETRYPQKQVRHWLSWLAGKMSQYSQTEFSIKQMQPDWLSKARSIQFYHLVVTLFNVPAFTLGVVLDVLLFGWLYAVLGLAFTVLVLFVNSFSDKTPERASGLSSEIQNESRSVIPVQEIRDSRRAKVRVRIFLMNFITLSLALLIIVFRRQLGGLFDELLRTQLGGLVIGLFEILAKIFFSYCILIIVIIVIAFTPQHFGRFVLRMLLWHEGSIPWNYPRFLDDVTKRILLRKVGDRYIFIHQLLLEYFASLNIVPVVNESEEQT